MKVEIVTPQLEHVIDLVERLREREREAFERLGEEPERMIAREVARSLVAWAGLADGKCAAIWGAHVDGLLSDEAYIWVVCSSLIEEHPVAFLRQSRKAIAELHIYFKRLHGLVVCDFERSVTWLEWLGFRVGESVNGVRAFEAVR